jgi:argininosuccinate lyase
MKEKEKQVTWGGRFKESPSELMLKIGESVSFDKRLALYDIACSRAHASMLKHVGILTESELDELHSGLDQIAEQIESGSFNWDIALEDVHMNIEQALTGITPVAGKLHTARSRNDQVATDMRLWFKDATASIVGELEAMIQQLLASAESHKAVVIPGYTHLQRAQPVPMAHHLLAYVEMFFRDIERFTSVWERANECPLGSGAICGTTLPIDRLFVASELGFVDEDGNPLVTQNSMDAVSDRDLFLDFANACATSGIHLSRLAEDFILWSSSEFGFVQLPDAFTTGSSLMPQKKNPDGFELIRGKSARLIGNVQSLFTLVKGLPLTYNRDLQEDKVPVFDSYDQLHLMVQVAAATLSGFTVNAERCLEAVSDPLLLATDVVDYLVQKEVAFRDAHHVVGALVQLSESLNVPLDQLPYEQVKAIHPALEGDWVSVFSIDRALSERTGIGMPNLENIGKKIDEYNNYFSD